MTGSSNKKDIVLILYQQNVTVFRTNDVAMLTGERDRISLTKNLITMRKGRLKSKERHIHQTLYNPAELACRIYAPSYVSLNYVMQKAGIVFQYDNTITPRQLSEPVGRDGWVHFSIP
ncbi:MAG: hypothetical protein R2759_06385 [Bacteroidales bacterium]